MRSVLSIAALLLVALAYLTLWPVPVAPVPWSAPAAPGYQGAHAVNQRLAKLEHLALEGDEGSEHVVVRDEGGRRWVWMAMARAGGHAGRIVLVNEDRGARKVIFDFGGRPLGFAGGPVRLCSPVPGAHALAGASL